MNGRCNMPYVGADRGWWCVVVGSCCLWLVGGVLQVFLLLCHFFSVIRCVSAGLDSQ
ncbi:hypothetical protein A2U01_0068684, partial [Trifolium medium]|nr:hypothetical protein [Trifolium medium]